MEAQSSEAEAQSVAPSRVSVRGKTDPAWEYGLQPTAGKNAGKIVCMFCDHAVGGGGISRVKSHLAGVKGDVKECTEVPKDVKETMLKNLKDTAKKTKIVAAQKRSFSDLARYDECSEEDGMEALDPRSTNEFDPARAPNRSPKSGSSLRQPEIKNALRGKDAALRTDRMIARFWLLRIVDSDEMPALGYVYEGYRRVEKAVMKVGGNSEIRALPYKAILGRRWEKNLDRTLIKAAYYLNPRFAYCDDWEGMTRDVHSSILDLIECPDFVANEEEVLAEKILYDKREKMFARSSVKKTAFIHDPSAWVEEPTADLEIDSLEAAFDEEDDYSHVDFGLGVGGATHDDVSTLGVPT
ncbi:hypothetical protein LINGRAHAP2_LOCUS17351 [Linum grandiflorum]